MKKLACIIFGTLAFTACSNTPSSQVPRIPESEINSSMSSASSLDLSVPAQWQYFQVNNLPFEIALPMEAVLTARNTKYRGKSVDGVDVDSYSTINDPALWAHNPKYFGFTWGKIQGYASIDEFLDSLCLVEGRIQEPGYKIIKRWKQSGIEIVTLRTWQCNLESSAMGRGAVMSYMDQLFVIFCPPGDWGSEGGKYFDIALHSIRPVE